MNYDETYFGISEEDKYEAKKIYYMLHYHEKYSNYEDDTLSVVDLYNKISPSLQYNKPVDEEYYYAMIDALEEASEEINDWIERLEENSIDVVEEDRGTEILGTSSLKKTMEKIDDCKKRIEELYEISQDETRRSEISTEELQSIGTRLASIISYFSNMIGYGSWGMGG